MLKKTLESSLDCKELKPVHPISFQSISIQQICPEYSLEGLMLKLKLQYFCHLMQRASSLENYDAGKDCRQKEKGAREDETVR